VLNATLPVVYLAAGEGRRLRPLTDERPKAMLELGGMPLAERALRSLRRVGVREVVAVTGHRAETLGELGDLVADSRHNPRFADANNIYSLWCARDVVARGCYVVNSDVLFEDEIALRLVELDGTALLCAAAHGVDDEAMKAVSENGRLVRLSKQAPVGSNPEYIGLTRVDPAHGALLAEILDGFVERDELDVYYESALEELARREHVGVVSVDGLAWIEIDDHADLARARSEVLEQVDSKSGRPQVGMEQVDRGPADAQEAMGSAAPERALRENPVSEAVSVWRRYMELPRYLRTVRGSGELAATLTQVARELGFARLCLVSGPTVTMELGRALAMELQRAQGAPLCVRENSDVEVEKLAGTPALAGADAVVAIGGGKTIDVAKSACELADLPVIAVPTQLTADGIASPVSVIRAHSGAVESRRARLPIGVVVDLDVIARSPVETVRAGLGDLLANPSALRDWSRAAAAGRETLDDFAALLARAASDLAYGTEVKPLGRGEIDLDFLQRLLQGLVLSGLAMEISGSSRPCSGSEHLISHAIDRLYPGTARHGEQVAFGTLLASRLQGEDWQALRGFMVDAGMERAVRGFGLSKGEIVAAVRTAPATRPGRYTVLDEVELTDGFLGPIVGEVVDD
jgi:glycerol-1-phosphate dehydrogenase [NAD(P)+]